MLCSSFGSCSTANKALNAEEQVIKARISPIGQKAPEANEDPTVKFNPRHLTASLYLWLSLSLQRLEANQNGVVFRCHLRIDEAWLHNHSKAFQEGGVAWGPVQKINAQLLNAVASRLASSRSR